MPVSTECAAALLSFRYPSLSYKYISSRFFENQPNEICNHLCEKASKGRLLTPEKLQNHSNEGKRKEKKKERGEGKEEKVKKSSGCTLSFYMQWNPVNTDTKGACYSVRIIRVSVLSGLSEKRQEHMFYRYKD